MEYGLYEGISFIVAPCNEDQLGYLPGDISCQVQLYTTPLQQALVEYGVQPEKAIVADGAASIKEEAYIEFIPHTYLRGSNLKNRVVIIDEAQNMDVFSMKKVHILL